MSATDLTFALLYAGVHCAIALASGIVGATLFVLVTQGALPPSGGSVLLASLGASISLATIAIVSKAKRGKR